MVKSNCKQTLTEKPFCIECWNTTAKIWGILEELKILIFEVCQIQSNIKIVSENQGIVALALLILAVLSEPNKWRVQNSWTGHKSFYYSAGRKSKGKEDEREEFSKSAVNSLVLLSLWLFVGLWGTRRGRRSLDDVEEKLKMLGRAGKGNRTRVESSQEGFYGQSIIFSMCNRCGRRTMIPKILGIRKQPRAASVSTSFRCGRPIALQQCIQKWFLNFPALFFCLHLVLWPA